MIAEYLIKFDEEIKSCDVCPFCKTNDDLDSEDYRHMYCGYPQMGEFVTDYIACRHPDCPLKEVPSHGVLWDRDKVFDVFNERMQMYGELGYKDDSFIIQELGHIQADLIAKVETVIGASTPFAGFCNTEGCSNSKPDMSKAQNHICPYYKGVCSLDENILCYCHTHYEMCDKFIEGGKEKEEVGNRCFINDTICEYANNNGYCCLSACLKNKSCEKTIQEEKEHKGTFDDPLPQPKYEPPKIMLV